MPSAPFPSDQPRQPKVREPLAVIGIGCRFPGGIDSPASYWSALLNGLNAIRDVPEDRWKHSRFHDTDPQKFGCIRNARGGFMDGVDLFDAEFFGYFPTEAQRIDPQQRLLLEVTHEAMEDAGLRRDQLDGSRTSVFVGSFMYDYLCMQTAPEQRDEINPYVAMGTSCTSLANRISYDFNLKGPSVSLDTACSSSLVAVHLACRSVWDGEADMALAGGVNLLLRPESSIVLSKGGFLNPDQYCKAFDASANGYVRSEGVGVVVLKPLKQALADGDAIYALVRATAVNQDGYLPEGFTVPNVFSQIGLLNTVYSDSGIDPLSVDFVEAHGTGTAVGDPIECLALGAVLGRERAAGHRCLIGSVKTNLGHLEGAAGIAGFIKGVLTAAYGIAPPNLHFNNPNPEIDFEGLKLEVPTKPTPFEREGRPLAVGVNSFGAGGTNAHVVIQELPSPRQRSSGSGVFLKGQVAGCPRLYMLSAAHRDSLRTSALRHADLLSTTKLRLEDLAYSAFARRSHYTHLLAVVGETPREVADRLRTFSEGGVDSTTLSTRITRKKRPKLAFVFSGQGGQWPRMGQQLMQREPVFREAMEEIDALFQQIAGWSLLEEIAREAGESRIDDTVTVQPAVMAIQIALVRLYEHYGILPRGIVGHSIGEVAAGFASGALQLEQAVAVIYHRSQAQNRASGKGGMLAVGLDLPEARKLIEGHAGRVSIGAVNGPGMLTLSGDPEPLRRIAELLESRGVFNRPVRVQVAYHSHHMEPIKDQMLETLAELRGEVATTPLYSTVSGRREVGTHLTAEYWFRNARQPVLFADALQSMIKDGFNTFLEIGPHPVLVAGAEALFKKLDTDAVIGPSMTRREPEFVVFLQSLARLATRGIEPDTTVLFGTDRRYVRLPKHPWQHSRYWFEAPAAAEMRQGRFDHPFLKRRTQLVTEEGLSAWELSLDVQKFPFLRDHQVDGEIVFPATGHLELAWAVANEQYRHEPFFLENLHFDSPLILTENSRHPLDVRLEIVSGEGDYRILSRAADAPGNSQWSRHSSGRINSLHDSFEKSTDSLADLRRWFSEDDLQPVDALYDQVRKAGLIYEERFRCIQQLWHRGHEVLAHVSLPDDLVFESQRYTIHPALFDACLHALFADVHRHGDPARLFLPFRIDRVRFYRSATRDVWSHVRVTRNDEHYLCTDTQIFDETGELVAEVLGMIGKRLVGAGSHQTDSLYEGCYEYRWIRSARDADLHSRVFDVNRAVLIADRYGVAAELANRLASEGIKTQTIPFGTPDSLDSMLANVPLDRRTLIVFAAGISVRGTTDPIPWTGLADCPYVSSLLELAQSLHRREGVPRLFVVTNGVAGVPGDMHLDLGQAILHGMSRVINNECPNVPLTVVDLSESISSRDVDSLHAELLHNRRDRDESEIALRGDERYVRQLVPIDRESAEETASSEEAGVGGEYRADLAVAGMLDQLAFRRTSPRTLGEDEVEIAVEAAGLSFNDIMNAMGALPAESVAGGLTGPRLGAEVAGRVLRTGSRVRSLQVGDEVIARVPEGFCGCAVTSSQYVIKKPAALTPQQAAAIPLVHVTAWYSLCRLARMSAGDTVLIHSAAGGVGSAAIQLAQRIGATVIATAGTAEKRAYVQQQGVHHVFDSRSLDFLNRVMDVTHGRGVDIVLNSLSGRFVSQSLKCLAPFGRFLELGKSDVHRNGKLNLQRLGENISYFVVDIDRLAAQKPDLHRQMMSEVFGMFERGELNPPPITEFPISRLAEAMKFMARAAYRGKIVLNMRGDRVKTLPPRSKTFRPDRAYLISAGASGFGLEVARWMAQHGARNLVLLSRSGCKSEADRAVVETMIDQGVRVAVMRVDITDVEALKKVMERIKHERPPLAGVIHGAAVMDDASIPNMNMARFESVFQPKAQGAWNLHEATVAAGANLDFFVMFSSISSVLGFYGQINYAAANFFQDSLAEYRRQLGLPATAVNLGVLGQYAGLSRAVNEEQDVIGMLESHGLLVMTLVDVLAKLETVLLQKPVQRMTGRFDWARFRTAYPHLARDVRFVELLSDAALARGSRQKGASLRTELTRMSPTERRERLQEELTVSLARILDAEPEKLDIAVSIDHLGLDSLMLTQLQVSILRAVDINVPLIKLLKGPSITTLSTELLGQLDTNSAAANGKDSGQGSASFTLADVEGIQVLNPWLIRGRGCIDAPCRLICFHSMGVGASLFTKFLFNPPDGYDILAVQTPGRENRHAEAVIESIAEIADRVVPHLAPLFDRPVVIWGHSLGGIVALEVIRRLQERHQCEPSHLLVTGTAAPHQIHLWPNREIMLKAMVAENSPEYLVSLSRFVDDPAFFKGIIPLMRRDWPLLRGYRFQPMARLNCPITAFAARKDEMVYPDEIREWSHHTNADFDLIEVDGDHWFLTRNRDLIVSTLQRIADGLGKQEAIPLAPTAAVR